MAGIRLKGLVKPAMKVAGVSIGAAFGGPLGGLLGNWAGHVLGSATAALIDESTKEFAKKAAEKIGEVGSELLGEQVGAHSIQLKELYRDTLRESLKGIEDYPEFGDYGDWFVNWELCFSRHRELDLSGVLTVENETQQPITLLLQTLIRLDAQGRQPSGSLSISLPIRDMPDKLASALENRLPFAIEVVFEKLIVTSEYEGAWKEVTRRFEKAAISKIVELAKTTDRIDARTQTILEELKTVLNILNRAAICPQLAITLKRPTNPWFLPPPRDKVKDIDVAIKTEARNLGVPDAASLNRIFGFVGNSIKNPEWEAEKRSEVDRNDVNDYLSRLKSWYNVSYFVLDGEHDAQTAEARSFYLIFRIANEGSAAAEKIQIRIYLTKDVAVGGNVPSRRWLEKPPEMPSVLTKMLPPQLNQRQPEPIDWYEGWAADELGVNELLRAEFFSQECDDPKLQSFKLVIKHLEHNSSQLTRPLQLNFKDRPASTLDVEYELHATNQPFDVKGKFRLSFVETLEPPPERTSKVS